MRGKLPWRYKIIVSDICAIAQKVLMAILLTNTKYALALEGLIGLIGIATCYNYVISASAKIGISNIMNLVYLATNAWLSASYSVGSILIGSTFSLLSNLLAVPLIVLFLYSIKQLRTKYILKHLKTYFYKDERHFEEIFRAFCSLLLEFELPQKGLMIAIISNHIKTCRSTDCPCNAINTSQVEETAKKIADHSLCSSRVNRSKIFEIKKGHSIAIEEDMTPMINIKKSISSLAISFVGDAINNIGKRPIIYIISSYFRICVQKNKYLAIYDLHKAECENPGFLESYYIFQMK